MGTCNNTVNLKYIYNESENSYRTVHTIRVNLYEIFYGKKKKQKTCFSCKSCVGWWLLGRIMRELSEITLAC